MNARFRIENLLADVLGSMCFALPEFSGSGVVPECIAASISFSGELNGELRLAVQTDVAQRLTADFLGCGHEEATLDQARAFSLELANIICGRALAAFAEAKRYSISLPALLTDAAAITYPYCFSIVGRASEIGLDFRIES